MSEIPLHPPEVSRGVPDAHGRLRAHIGASGTPPPSTIHSHPLNFKSQPLNPKPYEPFEPLLARIMLSLSSLSFTHTLSQGCQMNTADSERISGQLENMGMIR